MGKAKFVRRKGGRCPIGYKFNKKLRKCQLKT